MLDERKLKVIETLLKGENVSDTAKLCSVSRQTLYKWLDDDEFKAEMDRQIQEIKMQGQKRINSKLVTYVQEIENIALTSKSEKNKMDALIYLINRVLGTPTNKTAEISDKEENESKFDLDGEILNNVVDLNKNVI